jgi:hypothetical protein
MRRFGLPLLLVMITFQLGCSYAPKTEELQSASYGLPVTAEEMRAAADHYLGGVLRDPDSRRVEWGRSGRAWIWTGLIAGGTKYGYGIEALVNAKNGFGGYAGSAPFFFFFRDGNLVSGAEVHDRGMYGFAP